MSGTSLGRLYVDLLAKTSGFETDMGRAARIADKRAKEIDRSLAKMADRITSEFKGASLAAVGFVAGFASLGQIAGVVKEAIDAADKVDEWSARLGVSTEKLSALGYAAKLTGTDLDKIGAALPKLSAKIASGSEIFAAMGIDVEDANGKLRNSADLLPEIADRFAALKDDTLEQALAQELFSKSGAEMLEFLNLGGKGLRDMEADLKSLGGLMDSETAQAAAQVNDELDKMAIVGSVLIAKLSAELLPTAIKLTESLNGLAREGSAVEGIAWAMSAGFEAVERRMEAFAVLARAATFEIIAVGKAAEGIAQLSPLGGFDRKGAARSFTDAGVSRQMAGETIRNAGRKPRVEPLFITPDSGGIPESAKYPEWMFDIESMYDRIRKSLAGAGAGAKRGQRGGSGMSEETRAAEQLAKAYDSLIDRQGERLAQLNAELETGGKLGEAWRVAYDMQSGAMAELAEKAKKDLEPWQKLQALINAETEDQLALQAELRGKQADDAERFGEYLASLDREHEALGLSNLELQVRNAQMAAGIKLTEEQAAAIATKVIATEQTERAVRALDGMRDITQDLFYDMPNGAAEAWEKAIDQIEARLWQWAASGVLDQLFGEAGTTGKGSVFGDLFGSIFNSSDGNGFGGIFASVFGGARAIGGPVTGGKLYEVTERGLPELLSIGDRQLLMMPPGRAGMVTPMAPARGGRSGATTINHFHLGAPTERRTQDQIAGRVHYQGTRSTLRNS